MTVVPAYGRDYKSAKAACKDWNDGKDFIIADIVSPWHGRYVNRIQVPGERIVIRFSRLRRLAIVEPTKEGQKA